MKKNVKHYALYAADGVFVHPRYERAMICRDKYFHPPRTIIGYPSAEEALARARDHLVSLTEGTRVIPDLLAVDKFYYVKNLPLKCSNCRKEACKCR